MKAFFVRVGALPWVRQVAMGLLYGLLYYSVRVLSIPHWTMLTGFRLACVLLFPRRYWPALLISEAATLVYYNIDYISIAGRFWVVLTSLPPISFYFAVVWALRKYLPSPKYFNVTKMGALLLAAILVSFLNALINAYAYSVATLFPGELRVSVVKMFLSYFMNNYLGALMVVPPVLLAYQIIHSGEWRQWPQKLAASRVAMLEVVVLCLLEVAYCLIGVAAKDNAWRELMQVGLFLPVVWSALRFGWRGACLAGTAACAGFALLMPGREDAYPMIAQAMLGLAITTFLLLGSRTTSLRKSLQESRRSLALTRQELHLAELNMRNNAKELDRVHASLQAAHSRLLLKLDRFVPEDEVDEARQQLLAARSRIYRLADSFSPREWQRNGRPDALWNGPIADVLEVEIGVAYEVSARGDLGQLSPQLNMLLYRLGCEAVTFLLMRAPTDRISLRTTTTKGERGAMAWVELSITSDGEPIESPSRDSLLSGLGVKGLGEHEMAHRAGLYNGTFVFESTASGGHSIVIKLCDVPEWGDRFESFKGFDADGQQRDLMFSFSKSA